MGKKKIDELFQEKFKNFEQVPDEKVWQSISASLDKKKKRIIPIWWKLAGVAAVLVVTLLAINPFSNTIDGKPNNRTVEQQNTDSLDNEETKEDKILNTKKVIETQLTNSNSSDNQENESDESKSVRSGEKIKNSKRDFIFTPNPTDKKRNQLSVNQKRKSIRSNTDNVVPKQKIQVVDKATKHGQPANDKLNAIKQATPEILAEKTESEQISQKQIKQSIAENAANDEMKNKKEDVGIIPKETGIAKNETNELVKNKIEDSLVNRKKSIYDEIIEQEENALAENATKNRWSAGPSIAPVYFDAFGQGSPVHSILVPNTKSGNTNLSYGLSVAYEINNRLSVRSGIHKVDYGYETGEIEFSSSLDGAVTDQMDNIDYALTARNLVVKSNAGNTSVGVNNNTNEAVDASANSIARTGSMSQQFGYLEVPLELNYTIVDKKVGVNLIGGFSSLFLIDNSVSLTDGNQTTQMGEANNVNSLNFSTNIGLGLDYKFSPKIKLNIEPVFKYQLNTFNQVDGTFNPFSIGIYSGLTFRF